MELVKGRWYKNLGVMKGHIGKFSGWYDSEIISVSEYIYEDELRGASECFTEDYKFAKEIPLSEIQQYLPCGHPDKEFILPEKWCVKINSKHEGLILAEWANYGWYVRHGDGVNFINSIKGWSKTFDCNYTEITFEQFKKNVLKTKEMEEKEIIGYKLKEDCKQYEEAAKKIAGYMNGGLTEFKDYLKQVDSGFISSLKKAGVLDLWFEPVFKEKFKIGDWVTWSNGVTGRIVSHCKSFADSWSLDVKGDLKEYSSCSEKWLRLATPEEIKKTLVEEAIKRGFKEGVKAKKHFPEYSDTYINCISTMNHSEAHYESKEDALRMGGGIIYHKGKWAEILPSYPQIEINGYKGEFFDDYVKFGCAEIDKDVFVRLGQLGQGLNRCNRALESITIGKGTFTKEQIKLIAEYYLNKK